jgi:hypothetical protein
VIAADATIFRLQQLLSEFEASHDNASGVMLYLVHNITDEPPMRVPSLRPIHGCVAASFCLTSPSSSTAALLMYTNFFLGFYDPALTYLSFETRVRHLLFFHANWCFTDTRRSISCMRHQRSSNVTE